MNKWFRTLLLVLLNSAGGATVAQAQADTQAQQSTRQYAPAPSSVSRMPAQMQGLQTYTTQINALRSLDPKQESAKWGITTEEWNRYLNFMNSERGVWSPNLDPLTTLGVEAETLEERQRYARLLAERLYKRIEKETEFLRVYTEEFTKLYPDAEAFTFEPHISQAAGRVFYFTRLDDKCKSCKTDLQRIINRADTQTPVDIFIVGNVTDDDIKRWAVKNKIDYRKMQKGTLTLNHDAGYWSRYSFGKIPAAYQVKEDGRWEALSY